MGIVARPTRLTEAIDGGGSGSGSITVAQKIANGPDTTPMNLPGTPATSSPGITGAQPVTNTLISDPEDFDGDSPDTTGFFYNDTNIFESGGLNKSDPLFLKQYKAGFPKRKFTPLAYLPVPGLVIKDKGKDWEFVGYLGDELPIDDQENESFEAYEKSAYSGLFNNIASAKNANLTGATNLIQHQSPEKLALFRRFINPDHLYQSFDGYEHVEYAVSDDPAMSSFFLTKAFKAIGKGIGKAAKAVGKGVKNAVKATGKGIGNAVKWGGKTADKLTNWAAEKVNLAMQGKQPQDLNEAQNPIDWSTKSAAADVIATGGGGGYPTDYGNQLVEDGSHSALASGGGYVPTAPASNKNTYLIIAGIAAVVILGGLFIYKSK